MNYLFAFLKTLGALVFLLFLSACDPEEIPMIDPCIEANCINGSCIEGVCKCEEFWTGVNCDTVQLPTKMIITEITALTVEPESSVGPWDSQAGQEAPDLVFYLFEGFYFATSSFQGLSPIYRSNVAENYTEESYTISDLNIELEFGKSQTITVVLSDNDAPGTAFGSDFMEIAYIDLPYEDEMEPPFREEDFLLGTLQFPVNFRLKYDYE